MWTSTYKWTANKPNTLVMDKQRKEATGIDIVILKWQQQQQERTQAAREIPITERERKDMECKGNNGSHGNQSIGAVTTKLGGRLQQISRVISGICWNVCPEEHS